MKKLSFSIFAFFIGLTVFCQSNFDAKSLLSQKPTERKLVYDYVGILSADQSSTLEQKLESLSDNTSTQIAVVIVPNLGGYDVADFNQKLLRAWGVGSKKNNNGVVLLISKDEKKLNIATGYGVEGALPDITCKHIIDDDIVPSFKGNDYYRGIDNGTNSIIQAVKGEYNIKADTNVGASKIGFGKLIFYGLLILLFLILAGRNRGGGGGTFMSRRGQTGIGESMLWGALGGLLSGGGGGGSDSGGGGFGGFGGGSGGGGGASGSW